MNGGCCLYCAHAASYWIDGAGNKRVPPVKSFGDMNIYCLHESRAPGECYPISFARCTRFKRAQDDQIQRRRAFYSQFDRLARSRANDRTATLKTAFLRRLKT